MKLNYDLLNHYKNHKKWETITSSINSTLNSVRHPPTVKSTGIIVFICRGEGCCVLSMWRECKVRRGWEKKYTTRLDSFRHFVEPQGAARWNRRSRYRAKLLQLVECGYSGRRMEIKTMYNLLGRFYTCLLTFIFHGFYSGLISSIFISSLFNIISFSVYLLLGLLEDAGLT